MEYDILIGKTIEMNFRSCLTKFINFILGIHMIDVKVMRVFSDNIGYAMDSIRNLKSNGFLSIHLSIQTQTQLHLFGHL